MNIVSLVAPTVAPTAPCVMRCEPYRGIDCQTYYMVDTHQYVQLLNFSGCGNTGVRSGSEHPL